MNRKQYEIDNLPTQIVIGHQTETGVTSIYFDCTSWLASWPDLVLGVWATQPGGTAAYPAATHMEGDVLVWDVTDSDTAVPGVGTVEIVGITTGKKKLSAIAKTQIMRTTTGTTTTPPEGAKAWVDNVMQAANDAETSKSQAATYAQNAAAAAEKAEENAKSVTWETLSGKPSTFPPDSHTHTLESLGAASAESVNQLKNDIGDAWSSGKTYAVGDYCISGNRLYKCKTAHTAGSAFDADYWDAVSVASQISENNVSIERISDRITDIYSYAINSGTSKSIRISLAKGTTNIFYFGAFNKTIGILTAHFYCRNNEVTENSGFKIIDESAGKVTVTATVEGTKVTIPFNSAWLIGTLISNAKLTFEYV